MKEPVLFKDRDARLQGAGALQTRCELEPFSKKSEVKRWNEAGAEASACFELRVAEGAALDYVLLQNLPAGTEAVSEIKVKIEKNASLCLTVIQNGALKSDMKIKTECLGTGAQVQIRVLQNAKKNQNFAIEVNSIHSVPHTQSDLSAWCVARDDSRSIFNGLVTIKENAHHTEAYQKNKNLILSSTASVNSFPKLLIANDEVKCAHGSSTSSLDPEQFIYLQSRGIDQDEAKAMLTGGFILQALASIQEVQFRRELAHELGVHEAAFWTEEGASS